MTSVTTDVLLKGIGCNMIAKAPKGFYPEECFIMLSKQILSDPKALVLTIGAIVKHSNSFHPEFLLKALKVEDADLNVIGAILQKTKDRRFNKVIQYCHDLKYKSQLPSKSLVLAAQIGQTSFDPDFFDFGIKISEMNPVDRKKIASLELWMKSNKVVHNRVLFGCNWRADIVSAIEMGALSPTSIAKRLRCSYETAHRVFNDYKLIQKIA